VSKQGIGKYGPDDERALSIFGRYAAQAIVNADNIEELERQHVLLEQQVAAGRRLLELSEQLVSTLDPRRVLEQIAESMGTVVPYDRLTIYSCRAAAGGIEPVLTRTGSADGGDAATWGKSFDEGLTSWVIGRGDAVCANDVGDEVLAVGPGADAEAPAGEAPAGEAPAGEAPAGEAPAGEAPAGEAPAGEAPAAPGTRDARPTQNIIVVPLRVHGEVVGSLNLIRVGGPEAHFGEHEFELSKLFASQASIALQNAETHVTVSTRADLDALTGLRNHGTFERDLAAIIEADQPFSLLMMDLDSFKAFNDTYGHPAGDTLLRTVAQAIVSATRQRDTAYRYGGDEFALLLPGASRVHAEEVAGRVRAAVSAGVGSSFESTNVVVTASIGAAHWPADGRSQAALVEAADAALYRSKRQRTQAPAADAATRVRAPEPASASWADAVRDLIRADSTEAVAAAMVCAVTAICGGSDAFVALSDEMDAFEEPALAVAGGTARSVSAKGPGLVQIAASGAFLGRSQSIRRGGGLWGRVWESARLAAEDDGNAVRTGAPLLVGGRVVGILGVAEPSRAKQLGHASEIALVADLGSTALERLAGETD
jgi:diguanylate cyclase (GGDEF)-like protein